MLFGLFQFQNFGSVIPRIIHLGGDPINSEIRAPVGLQNGSEPFRVIFLRIKPAGKILGFQKDRDAVMDWFQLFTGRAGNDGAGLNSLSFPLRIFPAFPETGKSHWPVIGKTNMPGLFLLAFAATLPFIKARGRNNAAAPVECGPEGGAFMAGFNPRVDHFAGLIGRIIGPERMKAPAELDQPALALFRPNSRNAVGRRDVVAGFKVKGLPKGEKVDQVLRADY
ncbi:MAG TPA: hypothetical protein VJ910_12870 [Desulfuromonadales bacterium]|nr:hypothetical protein [Desulfuromonadales bacterium]